MTGDAITVRLTSCPYCGQGKEEWYGTSLAVHLREECESVEDEQEEAAAPPATERDEVVV